MIQISAQIAITLGLAFLGMVFGFGKMLLSQFTQRMDERLRAQDLLRQQQIETVKTSIAGETLRVTELGRKVEAFSTLLPLEYVRREDWIRFGATIDHKLDKLAELVLRKSE